MLRINFNWFERVKEIKKKHIFNDK